MKEEKEKQWDAITDKKDLDFIASASRDIWLNQQKSIEQMIIVSYSIES